MHVWAGLMRTERLNHIAYLKLVGDAFGWEEGGAAMLLTQMFPTRFALHLPSGS